MVDDVGSDTAVSFWQYGPNALKVGIVGDIKLTSTCKRLELSQGGLVVVA